MLPRGEEEELSRDGSLDTCMVVWYGVAATACVFVGIHFFGTRMAYVP
jgi:hypothetical protein